tara:strand:- start:387 stop:1253 length:867 start_codon:yes stop_codon:yes gene_type:complete
LNTFKHIILLPVYNDWKSLNRLLTVINNNIEAKSNFKTEILIINDRSKKKINIINKKLKNLKKIRVITLKNNLGSQKAIAIGLNYLSKIKSKFFITVMDCDGEDNPKKVKIMLNAAYKNKDSVITSNRKQRKESFLIILLYKIHLLITYFFTFKWMSFGNFTTFYSKNLFKILSNNSSWYAHASSVMYNCKIKRLYAKRKRRYYDKSNLSLKGLIEHSIRINSVFFKTVILNSIIYIFLIYIFIPNMYGFLIIYFILLFNLILFIIRKNHYINNLSKIDKFILNIKSF